MKIYNLKSIKHAELKSSRTGEKFSKSKVITELSKLNGVFITHEILPPERRSSSPHYHTKIDELVFVLEGEITAHQKNKSFKIKAGEFIVLKAGVKLKHYIENKSRKPARFLLISPPRNKDGVIY